MAETLEEADIQDDVLYRHVPGLATAVEVVKEGRKNEILAEFHAGAFGGHSGVNKTIQAIKIRYWWFGLTDDVKQYVRACEKCQMSDPLRPPQKPELHPIKVLKPFELVGIDLIGPLTETASGHKYLFTATDYFTKWVEAFPISTKSAVDVSRCIFKLFSIHGAMKAILTDQGREFVNQVNKKLCDAWNVKHKITAAYHPQTNGLDERTNQTIKSALRKMTNENQTDWDMHLDGVLFSLRTKPQSTTKYSPFYLLYGREAVYPSQLPDNFNIDNTLEHAVEPSQEELEAVVNEREERLSTVHESVQKNIEKAQTKQKQQYKNKSRKRQHTDFEVGNLVLVYNSRKASTKKKSDLSTHYDGPYKITEMTGKNVKLQNKAGLILKKLYSVDRLKIYVSDGVQTDQSTLGEQPTFTNMPEQITKREEQLTAEVAPSRKEQRSENMEPRRQEEGAGGTEPSRKEQRSEDMGPRGQEERAGGTEPSRKEQRSEDMGPRGQEERAGGTEPSRKEQRSEDMGPRGQEERAGGTEPSRKDQRSENMGPRGQEERAGGTEPSRKDQRSENMGPRGQEERAGGTEPSRKDQRSENMGPRGQEERAGGTEPSRKEQRSENMGPRGQEERAGGTEPSRKEQRSEDMGPRGQAEGVGGTEPSRKEQRSEDMGPRVQEEKAGGTRSSRQQKAGDTERKRPEQESTRTFSKDTVKAIVSVAVQDGEFQKALHAILPINVPKLKNIFHCSILLKTDPVTSFLSEVYKNYENIMDMFCPFLLEQMKHLDVSIDKKVSTVYLLSALFTKAVLIGQPVTTCLHTLKKRPPFLNHQPSSSSTPSLTENNRISAGGETLEAVDLKTLDKGNWLNDKVINAYLNIIKEEVNKGDTNVFVLPSYTATLWESGNISHWFFKKVKFSLYTKIFLPVNVHRCHWILLVGDVQRKTVSYLDSLHGSSGERFLQLWRHFFEVREGFIKEDLGTWTTVETLSNVQSDGSSCGIFTLMNAECIMRDVPHEVMRQVHCDMFREHIRACLFKKSQLLSQTYCDMPGCSRSRGHQRWIMCSVCGRWMHTRCCGIPVKSALEEEHFECIYCCTVYS